MAEPVSAIVTVPPYADFAAEVAEHPLVTGLRLNTVMPVAGPLEPVLERLAALGPTLWIDLKGRQLRVREAAIPPFTEVRLSHRLSVRTPVTAWFNDGREPAVVVAVDGDRLILANGPRRLVGPGESVNLVHPSLQIEGTLTDLDRSYVRAAREVGLHDYMLSYVEQEQDVEELTALDPDARTVLKVETAAGIDLARRHGAGLGRLMVGRGDLYVELLRPHQLVGALRELIGCDPEAIVASRLFSSLATGPIPAASDITDAAFLMALGFRTFLLGDEVCLERECVLAALDLLGAIAQEMA